MISNFFKIAYRNILRNKGFSIINISGLAIGMACAILILLWVQNEMSYDAFYANSDRLYQAWNADKGNDGIHCWNNTPKILGIALKQEYPEIEKTTRVNWDETILFSVGEKKLNVNGTMVDPDFLTMFQFPFIKGDINTALNQPTDIILTQQLSNNPNHPTTPQTPPVTNTEDQLPNQPNPPRLPPYGPSLPALF